MTRELAEFIGGTVDVRNEPGVGAIFTFKVPLEICPEIEGDSRAKRVTSATDENCEGELQGKRILIAEDNELNLEVLQYFLGRKGAELLAARDGKQAVEVFRNSSEGSIDMILMDIMMPELDGFSACREIRKIKTTPIIMLSARGEEYDKINAELTSIQGQIDATAADALDAQQAVISGRETLSNAARSEYRSPSAGSMLMLILRSASFDELTRNVVYASSILQAQADEVEAQKDRVAKLEGITAELNTQKDSQTRALDELEKTKQEAAAVVSQAQSQLQNAKDHAIGIATPIE